MKMKRKSKKKKTEVTKAAIEDALLQMGYRKLRDGWFKPVSFHVLCVKFDKLKPIFQNWFLGKDKQLHLWNSVPVSFEGGDNLVEDICYLEYQTAFTAGKVGSGGFGFLTKQQLIERELNKHL